MLGVIRNLNLTEKYSTRNEQSKSKYKEIFNTHGVLLLTLTLKIFC